MDTSGEERREVCVSRLVPGVSRTTLEGFPS